jgi:hypothetical protein
MPPATGGLISCASPGIAWTNGSTDWTWLLVVIVALVLLLAAVPLVVSQPGLTHAVGSLLQRPWQALASAAPAFARNSAAEIRPT